MGRYQRCPNSSGSTPAPQTQRRALRSAITSWNGIFAPAGTPAAVVNTLNTELQAVLADPAVHRQLEQIGFEVWPTKTPQEFSRYVSDQLALWGKLIQKAGIEPQ